MNKQERILCAAIWFNDGKRYDNQPLNIDEGYVICGRRHHNCIYTNYCITGNRNADYAEIVQGFITTDDKFVDRADALLIARSAGQILDEAEVRGKHLYSEDLY